MKRKVFVIAVLALAIVISGCAAASPAPPEQGAPAEPAPVELPPDEPVPEENQEEVITGDTPHHNARNSLDWAGVYQGIVPAAAGMGIRVQLVLLDTQVFELTYEHLEGDAPMPVVGDDTWGEWSERVGHESAGFEWDETGNVIRLDVADWPPYFQVKEGRITQLDLSGNLITGELAANYILTKVS